MSSFRLVTRDDHPGKSTALLHILTIVLLILVIVAFACALALWLLRLRRRRLQQSGANGLPSADVEKSSRSSTRTSNYHPLTVSLPPYPGRNPPRHVFDEKKTLIESSCSPPASPNRIPELRITFPEEEDANGRRHSGRVVVVHVGDTGVGLEPLSEDAAVARNSPESERFDSIDLERIGGLKER